RPFDCFPRARHRMRALLRLHPRLRSLRPLLETARALRLPALRTQRRMRTARRACPFAGVGLALLGLLPRGAHHGAAAQAVIIPVIARSCAAATTQSRNRRDTLDCFGASRLAMTIY